MKLFFSLYVLLLLALVGRLPLWLDEILTLIGAYQPSLAGLWAYIPTVPGGTPMTFLPARWASALFGETLFAGRVPSLLASGAASWGMYFLARRAGLKSPLFAVVVFAAMPLQLRYAVEARPYMPALAMAVWATELFLRMQDQERTPRSNLVAYVVLVVAAVMAQPYAAFVALGHLAWAGMQRRGVAAPLSALTVSAAFVLPWYAHFRDSWMQVTGPQNVGPWQWRTALVFLHEIAGSGYAGAGLLLCGAALGLRSIPRRAFWLTMALLPLIAVAVTNSAVHYFFAVRQVIYVLPVLAILLAAAAESAGSVGRALLAIFLAASLYEDAKWFTRAHEDWKSAADALSRQAARGACVRTLGDSAPVFRFFHLELGEASCGNASVIALGVSPYDEARDYPPAVQELTNRGFTQRSVESFAGPRVEVFAK